MSGKDDYYVEAAPRPGPGGMGRAVRAGDGRLLTVMTAPPAVRDVLISALMLARTLAGQSGLWRALRETAGWSPADPAATPARAAGAWRSVRPQRARRIIVCSRTPYQGCGCTQ
jgi:hypothetical protein